MMTTQDLYERLREHLDSLPVGFPKSKSGVELRILRSLFTKKEAEMACHLTPYPETVEQIAQRSNQDPKEVEPLLEQMAKKGLIFNSRKGGVTTYRAEGFAIGIYEHQVKRLTTELAKDIEQYIAEVPAEELSFLANQQLRVIPVHASLTPKMSVMPYEDARQIIESQSKIAVTECICRKEKELVGKGCDHPKEVCLPFSTGAYYYIEHGLGREITKEEALKILDQAEKAGLVCSPSNSQKNFVICNCCGCCCGILTNLKKLPKPSSHIVSNYYAEVDSELCTGCETCLDRCQMDAITIKEATAQIDLDYCIGCGLCVTTCPSDALSLKRKEESEIQVPPANAVELYTKIGTERLTHRTKNTL